METELGNPIEYSPNLPDDNNVQENPVEEMRVPEEPMYYYQPPPPQMHTPGKPDSNDFFSSLDKTAYIIIFVAFILGFFMGKTMQPVILRPG